MATTGGDSHGERSGILVVSFRGAIHRLWSHLKFQDEKPLFSSQGIFQGHAQIGPLKVAEHSFQEPMPNSR